MVSVDGALDDAWKKPKEPNIYKSKKIYIDTQIIFFRNIHVQIYMHFYLSVEISVCIGWLWSAARERWDMRMKKLGINDVSGWNQDSST